MITQRKIRPERMDDPDVDPGDLRAALLALERTNRRLGGVRAVLRAFADWSAGWGKGRTIRVLDVGTGSADIPLALIEWAASRDFSLSVTAVDVHPKVLAVARERAAGASSIEIVECDALRLTDMFDPGSFHYAHAGLFLHHLEDIEVMTVLRMMRRLAGRGLIWNDIVRSSLTRLAIHPFSWFGPPVWRHDARASRDAGFTRAEAIDIARRVGLETVRYRQVLWHRFILRSEWS